MFSKVLVANRGEIAVRINQTLRAMGISPVAVYSDPDAGAPHVRTAREAVALGGNAAEETYLDIPRLVRAATDSGADAVHPGYGFLSENPQFARACLEAGITFIGPTPESMAALGDKLSSKDIAVAAGVPIVPSTPVCQPNDPTAAEFADQWGLPVMVKAAAGGGGRGMRLVSSRNDLAADMGLASREASSIRTVASSLADTFQPRHVEVQVLADSSGNTITRRGECTSRAATKRIENPIARLTPELRGMGNAAVAVARQAGYVNAGTVEFLLDSRTGEFYFLEMNARLQVEHPVTEAVLGLDLVEWQLRIANGEPLTLRQDDVQPRGHAIECRIYAEDPYRDFVPSTGTLLRWQPPSGPGLRLDSGVAQGQDVSIYYDPMLAKLIAWAPRRDLAISRMEVALSQFQVLGVITNIPLLRSVMRHSQFAHALRYRVPEWNPPLTIHRCRTNRQVARALPRGPPRCSRPNSRTRR